MQLHQIKIKYRLKRIKRVGRGGKRGTYSGKGQKGQSSRAGRKIRPAERDLIQRIPKLRGFKFKPLKLKPVSLNLGDLEKKIKGNIINLKSLIDAGLISPRQRSVKILSKGNIRKGIEIQNIDVSAGARKKIEAAGGKIHE